MWPLLTFKISKNFQRNVLALEINVFVKDPCFSLVSSV